MSRTVTALYDTLAEAEAARQRLCSAADVEKVNIIDGRGSGRSDRGLHDYYMSEDDRHAYGEGLRRGGALLCAEVDSGEDSDMIVRALEETPGVDLEERQRGWARDGWKPYSGEAGRREERPAIAQGFARQPGATSGTTGDTIEEERIPIVEEELRVGKREVERGGARVRSYVRETPVHEQVTLREEHVIVERQPVEGHTLRGAQAGDDLLQERTIEMVAKAEEAVVEKVANVREEVVVKKTAEERTEHVEDTVRRTEVDVDDDRSGQGRPAVGLGGSSDSRDRGAR